MDDIERYGNSLSPERQAICTNLLELIRSGLPMASGKIWHGHPVWFIDGNPVVGYSSLKAGVQLLFWSGASFDDPRLAIGSGKFKDAHIVYDTVEDIDEREVRTWLVMAERIQWDYKNIVKRKGTLIRLR